VAYFSQRFYLEWRQRRVYKGSLILHFSPSTNASLSSKPLQQAAIFLNYRNATTAISTNPTCQQSKPNANKPHKDSPRFIPPELQKCVTPRKSCLSTWLKASIQLVADGAAKARPSKGATSAELMALRIRGTLPQYSLIPGRLHTWHLWFFRHSLN